MYKLLLISKYLRRKLAPLFAALAVTICTAMVIIVTSVMGGFLELMQTTAQQLTPQVVVQSTSVTGFEGYEDMIAMLQARDEVELATPALESLATINIGGSTNIVKVVGIIPEEYNRVVPYNETLLWSGSDMADMVPTNLTAGERQRIEQDYDLQTGGQTLTTTPGFEHYGIRSGMPAAVIGVVVNPDQRRMQDGSYIFDYSAAFLPISTMRSDDPTFPVRPSNPIRISLPIYSPSGDLIDASQMQMPVVNEFKTGYYELDKAVVFVPFDWMQRAQDMNERSELNESDIDPETGLPLAGAVDISVAARCTHVYIKAAIDPATGERYTDDQLRAACGQVVSEFLMDYPGVRIQVLTWEDVHGTLLGAVKNEKGLVTFLFAIISVVAIVMVATTFYMIVLEKTRDIGVLRAIGAPATGVLGLFLFYGLAIGIIGAAAGVWLAWFTVTNLNSLQGALANRLPTLIGTVLLAVLLAGGIAGLASYIYRRRDFSLFSASLVFIGVFIALMAGTFYGFSSITLPVISSMDDKFGWLMWDPQLYFFEKIPDQVDWTEVTYVGIGAVLSSVLGAALPAIIAARLNPVEALRYE